MAVLDELTVLLGLDASAFNQGLDRAGQQAGQASSLIGGAIAGGIATGVLAAGAALAGIGVAAWNVSGEIEEASRTIQNRLGLTAESADELTDAAVRIYNDGFAGSLEEVSSGLATVAQQMDMLDPESVEIATRDALSLAEAFDVDVGEAAHAAGVLVNEFGITSDEAFDLLATGFQSGLNNSDDFLDSIGEYSNLFADGGADAGEFFSILETGLAGGALGTDKASDLFKEFSLRIQDGSDSTYEALTQLFTITGNVDQEFVELSQNLSETEAALEANATAAAEAEGAFAASEAVVNELQSALDSAKRELDALSRPNLAGMQEFDDLLFNLEQQSNQVRLSMLDMAADTPEFDAAQAELDRLNTEMDRVALERDLTIEPQLRALERAASDGVEEFVTFDQAMAQVTEKRSEVDSLTQSFDAASAEMEANAANVEALNNETLNLESTIGALELQMLEGANPARDLFDAMANGSVRGVDAFQQTIDMLSQIEDPVQRNQIATALLGTQYEDLGASAVFGIDMTTTSLSDMTGAVDNLVTRNETMSGSWDASMRSMTTALAPLGDALRDGAGQMVDALLPIIQEYAPKLSQWLSENIPTAIAAATTAINAIVGVFTGGGESADDLGGTLDTLGTTWDTISTTISTVVTAIQTIIQAEFAVIQQFITEHGDEIQAFLQETWDQIAVIIDLALQLINNTIVPMLQGIAQFIQEHSDEIVAVLSAAWEIISVIIGTALDAIQTAITVALALIDGDWQTAWNAIQEFSAQFVLNLIAVFVSLGDGVVAAVQIILDTLGIDLQAAFDNAQTAYNSFHSQMIQPFINAFNDIKSAIDGVINRVADFIGQIQSVELPDWLTNPPSLPDWGGGEPEGRAMGGVGSGWTLVGEQGPELVNLGRASAVLPAGVTSSALAGSAGGGGAVVINADFSGARFSSEEERDALTAWIYNDLQQAISEAQLQGAGA